ncbi:MAG TPA: hypothetical protein VFE27_24360 [Acidobacteriaceae bacterium]|jgi:hypothetical protein|nr:hypothetical protein [Acidobacteriaceae bacterium]
MAKQWEELVTKNGIPQWKLTVTSDTPEDGIPISVFRGTKEQIAEALADSQANANRRIAELRRNNGGNGTGANPPAPRSNAPKPLTPADRMTAVAELNDPATVDRAVTRIIESQVGPMENLRMATENAPADREAQLERMATEAAEAFTAETPDYYVCPHNAGVMYRYIQLHGDLTKKAHYHRAFEELTAAQLLQQKPEEEEPPTQSPDPQPERNAPAPVLPKTPTRNSTGVRPSEMHGQPPARTANRLKYSREQIAKMSAATMKRLMTTDPEFVRCSEFYAQQDKPKRRAS